MINCYEVAGDRIRQGIGDVVPGKGVRLGTPESHIIVPFYNDDRSPSPIVDKATGRLVTAVPLHLNRNRRDSRRCLTGMRSGYNKGLLRCAAYDIEFRFSPIAAAMHTRWPGVEGIGIYIRNGRPQETDIRDDLVVCALGQAVYLMDGAGAVGVTRWTVDGFAPIRSATPQELSAYLLKYGMNARASSAIGWAWNSLLQLGMTNGADALKRKYKELVYPASR